jgi:hypothetical protein
MKKIFILIVLLIVASCSNSTKENEKPPVTVGEYSKQSVVMNGVINKILNEPDPKKMFTMADSIESTRAVSCIPIGEECNSYYKLINKVVNFTRSGSITNDQRAELFKLYNDFHSEIIKSEKDVQARWKKYITTQNLK